MRNRPIHSCIRVLSILGFAIVAGSAFADDVQVVVPGTKTDSAGIGNTRPFSFAPARYQQLNFAEEFDEILAPTLITEIAFRAGPTADPFAHTVVDLQINLSTAAVFPLSSSYATNVGSDDTTVFRGPLAMNVVSPKGGLRPFEIVIPLTTPFVYDPSAGDLLLDLRLHDNPNPAEAKFIDSLTIAGQLARVYCSSGCSVADSGGLIDGGFLITRFTFAPEPDSALAAAAVIAVLAIRARRPTRESADAQ